jgi:hypothetical protein
MNNFTFYSFIPVPKRAVCFLLFLAFILFVQTVQAQSPTVLWAEQFGSTSNDSGSYVVVDSQGDIYTTGTFSGTVTFGNTTLTSSLDNEAYVLKTDASGTVLWAEQFGNVDITVDKSGNIYTTGQFTDTVTFGSFTLTAQGDYDYFMVKYDTSGTVLWANQFTGTTSSITFRRIAIDTTGNVYVTGFFNSISDFAGIELTPYPSTLPDVFVVKLDASGTVQWAEQFERTDNDGTSLSFLGIYTDMSDDVYVLGHMMSMGGATTLVFGDTTLSLSNTSNFGGEVFLVKLNPDGTLLWANQYGQGSGNNIPYGGLAFDEEDNIYFGGFTNGTVTFGDTTLTSTMSSNIYVVKTDGEGTVLWATKFGESYEYNRVNTIRRDAVGAIYLIGYFSQTANFGSTVLSTVGGNDVFVAKMNNSGVLEWATGFGSTENDSGNSIAVDTQGDAYIAGSFWGTVNFGNTTLTSAGSRDAFLMKIGSTLAVSEFVDNHWKVYPNPAKDIITIELPKDIQNSTIEVFNTLGQKVKEFTMFANIQNFDIAELQQGVYLFRISNNGMNKTLKVYKQ